MLIGGPITRAAPDGGRPPAPRGGTLAALVRVGFLAPDDLARCRLEVLSRSHTVARLLRPMGEPVIVKHVNPRTRATGRSLDAEAAALAFAGSRPEVRRVTPRLLLDARHVDLIVIEDLTRGETPAGGADLGRARDAAATLSALGAWHHAAREADLPSQTPWPVLAAGGAVAPPDDAARLGWWVVERVQGDEGILTGLDDLRCRWRESSVVHGDVKSDNVMIGARTALVDWELAGRGDPMWDVGAVLAERLARIPSLKDPMVPLASMRPLLGCYERAAGAAVSAGDAVVLRACVAGRLLALAFETAAAGRPGGDAEARRLIVLARTLLTVAGGRHPRRRRRGDRVGRRVVADLTRALAAAESCPGWLAQPPAPWALRAHLYDVWWCGGGGGGRLPLPEASRLRAVDPRSMRFEGGWRVVAALPDGRVTAERDGVIRRLVPGDYASREDPCLPPRPGAVLHVVVAPHVTTPDGRQWSTASTRPVPPGRVVRLYVNPRAGGLPAALRVLLEVLPERLAWTVKAQDPARDDGRPDRIVVYIPRAGWGGFRRVLGTLVRAVAPLVEPGTPPLTLPLAAGVGLAEDPGGAMSFGEHRCHLLAAGILAARAEDRPAGLGDVFDAFRAHGIDPVRPHLHPAGDRALAAAP